MCQFIFTPNNSFEKYSVALIMSTSGNHNTNFFMTEKLVNFRSFNADILSYIWVLNDKKTIEKIYWWENVDKYATIKKHALQVIHTLLKRDNFYKITKGL